MGGFFKLYVSPEGPTKREHDRPEEAVVVARLLLHRPLHLGLLLNLPLLVVPCQNAIPLTPDHASHNAEFIQDATIHQGELSEEEQNNR